VARMAMFGVHVMRQVPFRDVYIHTLVRDPEDQKMSKTKGNVIDPIDVIDEYGADALRFTLATRASGDKIPLAKSEIAGYSAFANKIWNAARFALMHIDSELRSAKPIQRDDLKSVERWILSRLNATTRQVNKSLSAFRFDEASKSLYQFFWLEFCDWYVEMVKPVLFDKHGTAADKENTRRVLLEVLDRSLRLLHPFMPFITEEIWQKLGGVEPSIMVAPYPIAEEVMEDTEAERLLKAVQAITTAVRNVRVERGFTPKDRFTLFITAPKPREATFFSEYSYLLMELARLTEVIVNGTAPKDAHQDVIEGFAIAVEFPEKVITQEQIERTQKEIEKSQKELASIEARLANEQFVRNAPAAVVQQAQARHTELRARIEKLMQNQ